MSALWILAAALVVVMCLSFVGVLRKVQRAAVDLHDDVERLDRSRRELDRSIRALRESRAGLHRGSARPAGR